MKCPNCGFVSFDDLDHCKRCGLDLEAVRRGEIRKDTWLGRLKSKIGKQAPASPAARGSSELEASRRFSQREIELRRQREAREREFLAQEKQIRSERARLRRAYEAAGQNEQQDIREQMDQLERDRRRLRDAADTFEARQKALESKLREEVLTEKKKAIAQAERAKELEEKARREQVEFERRQREADEQAKHYQAERVALEAEREKLRQQTEQFQQQEEEKQRLAREREELAAEAKRLQQQQEKLEEEKRLAAEAREQPAKQPAAAETDDDSTYRSIREQWRSSLNQTKRPTAEDYLAVLNQGRARRQAEAEEERPPFDDHEEEEEVLEEVVMESAEQRTRRQMRAAPKGGLIFRSLAAVIDLVVLLMVVGLFLVLGRLITGIHGGDPLLLLASLGIPFYLLFMMLSAAYVTYMHGVYGQTLGKRLLGLHVVTTRGEPLGYLTAFFRFVAGCFAAGLLLMGVVWIALDPNKQGWHDKLARTVVIRK